MATHPGINRIEDAFIGGIDAPKIQMERDRLAGETEKLIGKFLEDFGRRVGIVKRVTPGSRYDDEKLGIDMVVEFANGLELAVDLTISGRMQELEEKLQKMHSRGPFLNALHNDRGEFLRKAHMAHVPWRTEAKEWENIPQKNTEGISPEHYFDPRKAKEIFQSFLERSRHALVYLSTSPVASFEDKKLIKNYITHLAATLQDLEVKSSGKKAAAA